MMKINRKYWLIGIIIFAILIIKIIVFSEHLSQKTISYPQLYISYHYTAEATYQDIEINKSKLIYTYFPEEIAKEKCAWGMIQSSPCWTEKDLRIKEAILSEEEINNLINLINETDFMNLKDTYGRAGQYQRHYSYKLYVRIGEKQKEVIYQNYPGASSMPEAFKKIKDKLFKLIDKKFK